MVAPADASEGSRAVSPRAGSGSGYAGEEHLTDRAVVSRCAGGCARSGRHPRPRCPRPGAGRGCVRTARRLPSTAGSSVGAAQDAVDTPGDGRRRAGISGAGQGCGFGVDSRSCGGAATRSGLRVRRVRLPRASSASSAATAAACAVRARSAAAAALPEPEPRSSQVAAFQRGRCQEAERDEQPPCRRTASVACRDERPADRRGAGAGKQQMGVVTAGSSPGSAPAAATRTGGSERCPSRRPQAGQPRCESRAHRSRSGAGRPGSRGYVRSPPRAIADR